MGISSRGLSQHRAYTSSVKFMGAEHDSEVFLYLLSLHITAAKILQSVNG
jgi:hypothetical protein